MTLQPEPLQPEPALSERVALATPATAATTRGQRDVQAAVVFAFSRLAMLVIAAGAGWLVTGVGPDAVQRWSQWDAIHYLGIAQFGYGGEPTGVPNEAFFPGFPALSWLGHQLGLGLVGSGLLVSLVAGFSASVALSRLARLENPGAGNGAVWAWVLAPTAVFLAAPYTEAVFCAFAFWAWWHARQGRWVVAVMLAATASTLRISGVFLAAALAVEWLTRSPRRWSQAPLLMIPLLPVIAYFAYLKQRYGSWTYWFDVQEDEWYREFTWPWTAIENTWNAAFGADFAAQYDSTYVFMFRAELVALVIGVALTLWLLVARRWGEATWVGAQVAAFVTSYWVFSLPRATLLWWPLFVLVAVQASKRPWVGWLYASVCGPLMVLWTATYLRGGWAG